MGNAVRAALVAAAALPAASLTACTTHQCDPVTSHYAGGEMVDPDTYETSPLDSPVERWIDYRGGMTVAVTFPQAAAQMIDGRPIVWIDTYVGVAPECGGASSQSCAQPNHAGDNSGNTWTVASGQLAELADAGSGGFLVTNASCADYFARFVVHFAPAGAGETTGDAGAMTADAAE